MPRQRQVYLLDPQIHSPEIIAVAFAKTSRSPESFDQIASELSNEKSAEFHEKWVVGYGHSSVAEHAVLHIAVENVSRLAVECLESNRLASYTEKSTRYQQWGISDFYIPHEFSTKSLKKIYLQVCEKLFALYEKSLPCVMNAVRSEIKPKKGETETSIDRRVRTTSVDVCRFLLPVSAYANVGMTINARALEHAITKMLSHPLDEVRSLGQEIKSVSIKNIPTLLKYADEQRSLQETESCFQNIQNNAVQVRKNEVFSGSRLISYDHDIVEKVLAASLAKYNGYTYTQSRLFLNEISDSEKSTLIHSILGNLTDHDIPIRELEYGNFEFEIVLDQGAYLELKRHRMTTQTPLPFSPNFGYAIPRLIEKSGMYGEYCDVMELARTSFEQLSATSKYAAAYVLPNAFNRCLELQANFRSLYHLIRLRTAPNAHFSIRRIGHMMADQVKGALPVLGAYLRVNPDENAQSIEDQHFHQV
jgi:thymidylate synthase ThyX